MLQRGARWSLPALVAAALCAARPAEAAPQWNAGVVAGLAGIGDGFRWSGTEFYGAARGEVLFGRSHPLSVGLGPALEIGTAGFADARFGGGATLLVPLDGALAVGVSPGAFLRTSPEGAQAGLSGRLFFGLHPANRVGCYAMTGGLLVGVDRDVGASRSTALVAAVQIDGLVLALPAMLLIEWLRGPRD